MIPQCGALDAWIVCRGSSADTDSFSLLAFCSYGGHSPDHQRAWLVQAEMQFWCPRLQAAAGCGWPPVHVARANRSHILSIASVPSSHRCEYTTAYPRFWLCMML